MQSFLKVLMDFPRLRTDALLPYPPQDSSIFVLGKNPLLSALVQDIQPGGPNIRKCLLLLYASLRYPVNMNVTGKGIRPA